MSLVASFSKVYEKRRAENWKNKQVDKLQSVLL